MAVPLLIIFCTLLLICESGDRRQKRDMILDSTILENAIDRTGLDECTVCEYIAGVAENFLSQNKTEEVWTKKKKKKAQRLFSFFRRLSRI